MKQKNSDMTKRWLLRIAGGAAAYLLMLLLLTLAEGQSTDGSIRSFGDAFWYSVVTLSTVGYGDLYPVTAVGRVIGFCFVLMSLGVLAFIMGAILSFLTGHMLPALQLKLLRGKQWFVFSQLNESTEALAEDLEEQYPDGVFLFPRTETDSLAGGNYRFYPGSLAQAVAGKKKDCIEHLRWMRFHSFYNWRYAPIRDNAARLHPMMRPFEELSPEEQIKDDFSWELLDAVSRNADA